MNVTVRQAQANDALIIADFNVRLAAESEAMALDLPTVQAGVQALLRDPKKGRYFVAVLGERVIGQAAITFEWSDWRNGWLWWLQSVYVDQEHRSAGVFRSIYDAIRRAAAAEHVVGLRLYVDSDNEAGMRAYRSIGMRQTRYQVFEEMLQPA